MNSASEMSFFPGWRSQPNNFEETCMKPVHIMVIFGTRPEAIKLTPVIKALKQCDCFRVTVAVTAQHRDMLDQVLNSFGITADFDLDIMRHSQTLTQITTRVLTGIESVLDAQRPDFVLVHGDTTTTFAASLAAFYHKIPIGHVEAGLRTADKYSPFPEEINRRLTGALCDLHFAPTQHAKNNLLNEGVPARQIFVTGNTVIDVLLQTIAGKYEFKDESLKELNFSKPVILLTCHRRENTGEPMRRIFEAIRQIAQTHSGLIFVFPVHPNTLVSAPAEALLSEMTNVRLIKPLGYKDMVNLMNRCLLVLTDSGGIQEEAVALGKPVLVLRDTTERSEAVDCGAARLIGTQTRGIIDEVNMLLSNEAMYKEMSDAPNPFGDGTASKQITAILANYFSV